MTNLKGEKLQPGDIIKVKGLQVQIAIIEYQYYYDGEGYNTEFRSTDGVYRSWKQYVDGGEVYRK